MVKILFIRHGYSKANELNLFLGFGNMDLTEIGLEQAKSVANYLKDIEIDAIYSSDLIRTIQTATPTARIKGLPIITNEGLKEINAGKWEYMPFTEIAKTYPEDWFNFCNGVEGGRCTDGESFLEAQSRFYNAVLEIAKESEDKTIAIFSHATTIKSFVTKLKNLTAEETVKFPLPTNCSVTTIIYDNGKFTLEEFSKDDFMKVKTALEQFNK